VEGLFLLALEEIRRLLDHAYFIDCPEEIRVKRILRRDLTERGKTYDVAWANIQRYVLPMHKRHVEPFMNRADLVLHNDRDDAEALCEAARTILERLQSEP
jgi:uridine kinase